MADIKKDKDEYIANKKAIQNPKVLKEKGKPFQTLREKYREARNKYTTALKGELMTKWTSSDKTVAEKAREDYLQTRIEIMNFDSENLEDEKKKKKGTTSIYLIFDSHLAEKSGLLTLYPFQQTEQESAKSKTDSTKNYYDLFVKYSNAKPLVPKKGVYENILNLKSNTFEKKKDTGDSFDYGVEDTNATFLSPFALYKVWLSEPNSYALLKKLLSFLPPDDMTAFETKLIEQFDEYDKTKRAELEKIEESPEIRGGPKKNAEPSGGPKATHSYELRSKTGSLPISRGAKGGGHHVTPRLKRNGRKTKKLSKEIL